MILYFISNFINFRTCKSYLDS